jgi:uncharacterized Ntn-hydrolase superfamily protein
VARAGFGYGGSDIEVDLRVDDDGAPVETLARLLDLHELYFTRPDPASLLELRGPLAAEVGERLRRAGYPPAVANPAGAGPDAEGVSAPAALDAALASWAGVENLEERLVAGSIDPLVLAMLRRATGGMSA